MTPARQYCTFRLDGHLFGVEVGEVQEVIRFQEMTKIPLAPEVVSGLINLRGQIVTAIDLRPRLGLPARSDDHLPMNVVVHSDDYWISLLVDEIGDVIEVDESLFEDAPETLSGSAKELILGAFKLENELLLALNTKLAITIDTDGARSGSAEESAVAGR